MTSILKRYIIWNINENDNHESTKYFYNDKKKCTSIYLSLSLYIYIYYKTKTFDDCFLLWLHKLIPHIYLKISNICNFSFFNRHLFWSIDTFLFNRRIFIQQTHFRSIGTFWYIQYERLWSFNKHFLVGTLWANRHFFLSIGTFLYI